LIANPHTAHCLFCLILSCPEIGLQQKSKELLPTRTPKTTQSYVYIIQVIVANGTFQRFAIAVLMHFVAITGIM
jgi:hypothetical protein